MSQDANLRPSLSWGDALLRIQELQKLLAEKEKELAELNAEKARLWSERVNEYARASRIVEWLSQKTPNSAKLEFTEGPERQIGYAVENWIFKEGEKSTPAAPEQAENGK